MEPWQLQQSLSLRLSPRAKLRIRRLVPRFTARLQYCTDPQSVYREALVQLRSQFPPATPAENAARAAYLVALASIKREDPAARLEFVDEIGEMEALRMQMLMDRQSKLMSTLSNILKSMAETSTGIIQNLK